MNVNVNVGTPVSAGYSSDARSDGEAANGELVAAVVKWFREDKGYGFVELPEGRGDAFLHAKTLRSLGLESVPTGATLRILVEDGPRGAQVGRVLDVDASTSSVPIRAVRFPRASAGRPQRDLSSAVELTGKVKWFDDVRGFGFVACDDFGRDVFVHCSIRT